MTIFNVANSAQLAAALATADGADTIRLAGGNYGVFEMRGEQKPNYVFPSEVTITSASPDNPAVFNGFLLQKVSNVTLDGLVFDFVSTAASDQNSAPFVVNNSSHITIRNAVFDGDAFKGANPIEAGFGTGNALRVNRSDHVTIEDSDFSNFLRGAGFASVDGLEVKNNSLHGLSGDALTFSQVTDVLIEGNEIRDFESHPDSTFHRDMIQFWTSGSTAPSTDVVIRGNVLHSGEGSETQSIFIRNEVVDSQGGGSAMYYRNFLIENNVIYNAQAHGITVGETDGLIIRNNTVLHNPAAANHEQVYIPKIDVSTGARNVTITNNIADAVPAASSGWTVSNNLLVQRADPLGDTYYDKLFVAANRPDAPLEGLQALPGGLIETLGVGAAMTRFDATPDGLTALARETEYRGVHFFDAGLTADPGGLAGDAASYRWNFGDGVTATGKTVTHSYASPGDYVVTLTASKSGASDDYSFIVQDEDPVLLALRFGAAGPDDVSSYDTPVSLGGSAAPQVAGSFLLTNSNYIVVDNFESEQLHALEEFTLSLDLQRSSTSGGTGLIMHIPSSWRLSMNDDGKVSFTVTNDAGRTFELTSDRTITDAAWHNVEVAYDSAAGSVAILIDGARAASTAVTGTTPAMSHWSVIVGNASGTSFNGRLRDIDITKADAGGSPSLPVTAPPPVETASPAPVPAGDELSLIAAAISTGAYKELADSLSKTLADNDGGDAGDNVVLAGTSGFRAARADRGGDDILIGDAAANWLVDGAGDTIMAGLGGADDFRFSGGYRSGSDHDIVMDLDFTEGDRLVLTGYDGGTFSAAANGAELNVFSGGAAAIVGSLAALKSLAATSGDVTLDTGTDRLTLDIDQNSGHHTIDLTGVATASAGGSGTGAPAPVPAGDGLSLIAAAISTGAYKELADSLSKTLADNDGGDAGDNVVLAGTSGFRAARADRGGDDILIGDAAANWLVDGAGDTIMAGLGGADDFRFSGGYRSGSDHDIVMDLDFTEGDRLVLTGYDGGTFSAAANGAELNVFSGGAAAIVGSLAALKSLAATSGDVTLDTGTDRLTLDIDQNSGHHTIDLTGVATASAGGSGTGAPAPVPAGDGLSLIAAAISTGAYKELADSLSKTLADNDGGDAGDNVVLAGTSGFRAARADRGGDDILIGDAAANWLVDGAGDTIMAGLGGADDFRFSGGYRSGSDHDIVMDLDFTEGDRLVLTGYDGGTFSAAANGAELNVFSGGAAAIVGSLAALKSLAATSGDVTLDTGTDRLTLDIDQNSGHHAIDLLI